MAGFFSEIGGRGRGENVRGGDLSIQYGPNKFFMRYSLVLGTSPMYRKHCKIYFPPNKIVKIHDNCVAQRYINTCV